MTRRRTEYRLNRSDLLAHLGNLALFRRAFITLDWVPRGVCTKIMRYVFWEDEGLNVRWLWRVDANPIGPGDENETYETPC